MQAAYTEDSRNNQGFHLLGTVRNSASNTVHLISQNTSLLGPSRNFNGGVDTCSFYSGPSDSTILSFAEKAETCGSIAYDSSESCGSIAYSDNGEACGSVASTSSFSGCACSYSC